MSKACYSKSPRSILTMDPPSPKHKTPIENPAPKADNLGKLMALNGYWDSMDDDKPGMFKEEGELREGKARA